MLRECEVYLPTQPVPYLAAWQWQKQLLNDRLANPHLPDALILLEHPAVYTLGQGSSLDYLKFSVEHSPLDIYRTERGGEVTYHAIGQLVAYPILNLRYHRQDLHWYLRQLETVIIRTLENLGLNPSCKAGLTGVWLGDRKVAQIGIKVSRWITMHGFGINVAMDMTGYDKIIPCGLKNYGCTQLKEFIPDICVDILISLVCEQFGQVFNLDMIPYDR